MDDDTSRRALIFHILVNGLIVVICVRLLASAIHHQPGGFDQEEDALLANSIFLATVVGLRYLARCGQQRLATFGLLGILLTAALNLTLRWSFELPISELMYALVIVVAGILLTAQAALIVTGSVATTLLAISYLQITHHLHPYINWVGQDFQMADAIGYAAVLCLIALVSWLTNREINQSLQQARVSGAALAKERDSLELKVTERTQALEQAQQRRTVELQKFAEFGRLSANLLHEIANPLTAASLSLEQYQDHSSHLVTRALHNLQAMERYLEAARQQIRSHGNLINFSVDEELDRIARVMVPLANHAGVKLTIRQSGNCQLYGDPVKFNQLVANLIANALDAYTPDLARSRRRRVDVTFEPTDQGLKLRVSDWGQGIPAANLPHVFETFYTTKNKSGHGLGLGLSTVKQYVTIDFQGSIDVKSSRRLGTHFDVDLRSAPA